MSANKFLAGPGDALFFRGNNLIGVGKTLTESTFDYTITAEEVRGGRSNALFGCCLWHHCSDGRSFYDGGRTGC